MALAYNALRTPAFTRGVLGRRSLLSLRNSNCKRRSVATMAALTAYVKGDPEKKILGDCPFCHRVLLTLETKNIPYSQEYIDFDHKPDWLQEKAQGKVPVIDDEGNWVADSDEIVKYLEKKFPEPSMDPSAPSDLGSGLLSAFKEYLSSKEDDEGKQQAFTEELSKLNNYLAEKGPFFGGDHLDATDAKLSPRLYHTTTALAHYKGYKVPDSLKGLDTYFDKLKALPAWKNTDYGTDLIIKGWKKLVA